MNAICPGYVWTPLVEKQIPDTAKARGITEEQVIKTCCCTRSRPRSSFSRGSGGPAAFLASDDAASITGAILPIDGGWTAQ